MGKVRVSSLAVVLLPICILTLGASVFLGKMRREVIARLPQVLSTEAGRFINGRISVGDIESFANAVVLRDVTISADSRTSATPIVKISAIKVYGDIKGMVLRKEDPVKSIRRIDIVRPEVLAVRDEDGRWEIRSIFKPSQTRPKPVSGITVNVRDGQIRLVDRYAQRGRVVRNAFTSVDGRLTLGDVIGFTLSADGQRGRLGQLEIEGKYRQEDQFLNAVLDVADADAAYWTRYPRDIKLNILDGRVSGTARLSRQRSGEVDYAASLDLEDGAISFRTLHEPIRGVNGRLEVRPDLVALDVTGSVAKSPVVAKGYVLGFKQSRLSMLLTSDTVNIRQLATAAGLSAHLRSVHLPSNGSVRARLFGLAKKPGVMLDVDAPSVGINGQSIADVHAEGVYYDGKVQVSEATGSLLGGTARLKGDVSIRTREALLTGAFEKVNLAKVQAAMGYSLSGSAGGVFDVLWKNGESVVSCRAYVKEGTVRGYPFRDASLDCRFAGGSLDVHEFRARTFGGLVAAEGTVSRDGGLRLTIAGSDLDIARASALLHKPGIAGRLNFAGKLSGSSKSPVFDGDLDVYGIKYSSLELERVAGHITAGQQELRFPQLVAYDSPGSIVLSGVVKSPLAKAPSVDARIEAKSIDIDRIARQFGKSVSTGGSAGGTFHVSGLLTNPQATGDLKITGLRYCDMGFEPMTSNVSYRNKTLFVKDLTVSSGKSTLAASGSLRGRDMNIAFNASDVQLERLAPVTRKYARLKGQLSVSGKVTGTPDKPSAKADFTGEGISVNGQSFTQFGGVLAYDDRTASLQDFILGDGTEEYRIPSLSYDGSAKVVSGTFTAKNSDAGRLQTLLRTSAFMWQGSTRRQMPDSLLSSLSTPVGGTLNAAISGELSLAGKKPIPQIRIAFQGSDLKYGDGGIKSIDLEGSWEHDLIKLAKLEALDGDTNISASGAVGPEKALALEVDVHNLSMDRIRQWVRLPYNFSGSADVTLVATGRTDAPETEAYIEFVDPVLAGVKFDRLRSRLSTKGPSEGAEGKTYGGVSLDELRLVKGDNSLKLSGFVPVDWRKYKLPPDGEMNVKTDLDEGSLQIVSEFTGVKLETAAGGEFGGKVGLAGTVQSPRLEGRLVWSGGIVQVPRLGNTFTNIRADLMLNGDKLAINEITGQSSEGGTFRADGVMQLSSLSPTIAASVKTHELRVTGRNVSNVYGEEIKLGLDSDLRITGDLRTPLIAGTVKAPSGSLTIASTSGTPAKPGKLSVDPRFDIRLISGRKVELKAGRLRVPLFGELTLAGFLSRPIVDGRMDISDGTILFPMRTLRIAHGSNIVVHAAPPEAATMFVDMQAEGRVSSMSMGRTKYYRVTMTARGPVHDMSTSFTSSPPELPEQTIVALLTGPEQLQQAFADGGSNEFGKVFSTAVMPTVFQSVGEVFQNALGLDEFDLEMGYNEPLRITIGDRIFDDLYVDYMRVLGSRLDYSDTLEELKLSYRLKRGMEFHISSDQNKALSLGVEGKIKF